MRWGVMEGIGGFSQMIKYGLHPYNELLPATLAKEWNGLGDGLESPIL